jgi:aminoglycoside phosphotransferase (APT) family kinase protein
LPVFTVTVIAVSIADETDCVKHPAELDTVLDHLRRQFHAPKLALDGPPIRLGGGFWAEMWTLILARQTRNNLPASVVLRLAPDAQLAAWETTFQAGVAEQGYPTPIIHASDFEPRGSGRAWCVMDHANGTPLLAGLGGLRALAALPRLATGLPDTLARAAADLHRLDPRPIETALRRATDRTIGVDGLLDHYLVCAQELADAPLQQALERLATTRPDSQLQVVCHGDHNPFNVLADGDRCVVLDWTAGQIAHPAYDLAFTHLLLANPPLHAPRAVRPIINAAARRVANRFITTYRKIGPHPIDADTFDWYRTLQSCRILTDLATWRAADELGAHRDHPWFAMEAVLPEKQVAIGSQILRHPRRNEP